MSAAISIDGVSFVILENLSFASAVQQNVAAKRRTRGIDFEIIVID